MLEDLLLHTCCGPCGLYAATKLREDGYDVTLFFYNPNIFPDEEYQKRLSAIKEWADKNNFEFVIGEYNHNDWLKSVAGLEKEPEGGARCSVCFSLRLEGAAKYAKENNFEIFATTLTSGRNKKADIINPIGLGLAEKYGLKFYEADWKKGGGQEESRKMAQECDIYRQHYCGCEFSISTDETRIFTDKRR